MKVFILKLAYSRNLSLLFYCHFLKYISDPYIPMFYYITKENVEYERADPGSQLRSAGPEYENDQDPPLFLWNQALYVIAQLLTSNLLHINELDPIRRYLPSYNRPKRPGRYSAFQVRNTSYIIYLSIKYTHKFVSRQKYSIIILYTIIIWSILIQTIMKTIPNQ